MKTIPKNRRHLSRMFSAQPIRPRPSSFPYFPEDNIQEAADHDFLVISTRPDLTPQLMTPALPYEIPRAW